MAWQAVPALQAYYSWLHSPSAWQRAPASGGGARTVHDDLLWMRGVQLWQRLVREGVEGGSALSMSLPQWLQSRAPVVVDAGDDAGAALDWARTLEGAYTSSSGGDWYWLQAAEFPCKLCCSGGQA